MAKSTNNNGQVHVQWSSRWAFIMAATGSAVGLGNIWKFPYMVGEGGGAAFVFIYLISIALIGIPIMMAEVMLGRRGRRSPINTMRLLAKDEGCNPLWKLLGWMGVVAGFLILSYYSVIAGWTFSYAVKMAGGVFYEVTADGAKNLFGALVGDPERLMFWHTLFMIMTVAVVAKGVEHGIEKAVKFLMPALFILLIALVFYSMVNGDFGQGVRFLFTPDFSKVTLGVVISAVGQAFFSLSLGMGAIMIYGSYLPQDSSIAETTITIALADTLVAILAGLAIFPIVFSSGLEAAAGPSLIFQTLPIAFGQMPGGLFWGTLFFVLLLFAAWTSAISLIEPVVAWLTETKGYSRMRAAIMVGLVAWTLGIVTAMSFSTWAFEFDFFGQQKTSGLFDVMDILTSNIILPVGGILIAVFAGWKMHRDHTNKELAIKNDYGYDLWLFLVKYVAPISVAIVLLSLLFNKYF